MLKGRPPPVTKPERLRDLGPIDVSALAARVHMLSERAWATQDALKENNFAMFSATQHLIFRFIHGNHNPNVYYDSPGWEIWKPLLMPIMEHAISAYGMRDPAFPKAMLARLAAGREIAPHVDGAGSNLATHKIHVPLVTNPDAWMRIDGEEFHLEVGRCYEVNNIVPHGVRNGGSEDRIHFIFEVHDRALIAGPATS